MSQKVWVIDGQGWNGAPAKSWARDQSLAKSPLKKSLGPIAPQRSPALSFSFSMLIWGSGHMYIREYRPGSVYMVSMFLFYSALSVLIAFRYSVGRFISEFYIPPSLVIFGSVVFLTGGLVFWGFNAVDAYYRTARLRFESFRGVDNELWPLLCSFIFPGWGQFLNGQPQKGVFFLLFGLLGTFSAIVLAVAQSAWSALKTSPDRFAFEIYLVAALLVLPISLLMWIIAAHDAFWSCREPVRKRPLLTRLHYFRERARAHGITRTLVPKIRSTVLSGLLLTVLLLAGIQYFPRQYYVDSLEEIRIEMLNSNMRITPNLVRKAIDWIDRFPLSGVN